MNEIITVNFDTQTVSARELHKKVGSTERFSSWFTRQLQFGFAENEDYTTVKVLTVVENNGGVQTRELVDHDLTVDMAKHICMVQRTEKAKQVRQYLIDLEKAWNTPEQVMARALKLANSTIDSLKDRCKFLGGQVVEQQKIIEEMQPKVSYYDLVLQCKDLIATSVIAKDYGMSATTFNKLLHELKIQYKQCGVWLLYSNYQNCGYTKSKTHNYADESGLLHSKQHSYWTQKGRLFLYDKLKEEDILPLIENKD